MMADTPPATRITTAITGAPIDAGAAISAIGAHGAVASFIGHVRADDGVTTLLLDHHPVMTAAALDTLARAAAARWSLDGVTIIHRIGAMAPGDCIVLVATAARHRAAALDACAYCIDRLKTDVPLWKRETRGDGASYWVEPRDGDAARSDSWA